MSARLAARYSGAAYHGNVAVDATKMELPTQPVAIVNMPLSVVGAQAAQELDRVRVEPGSQDSGYPCGKCD